MRTKIESAIVVIAAAAIAGIVAPSDASAVQQAARLNAEALAAVAGSVLIVNNHLSTVRVYAVDETGKALELGRLARSGTQEFKIPEEAVDSDGAVIIKVVPDSPLPGLGTSISAAYGVKTRVSIDRGGETTVFWLEPELTNSFTQAVKG